MARELREETGVRCIGAVQIYEGDHGMKVESTRGRRVHVFRVVECDGEPEGKEPGCPVAWLTREEFQESSPFAAFYERVWPRIDRSAAVKP